MGVLIEGITKEEFINHLEAIKNYASSPIATKPIAEQTKEEKPQQEIYTIKEAADYLRTTEYTLRRKCSEGKITFYNDGKIKIKKEHMDQYLKQYEKPSTN